MKKLLNIEPLTGWFGYTRRERRSSFILLLIIVIILGSRYALPEKTISIEDSGFTDSLGIRELSDEDFSEQLISFYFDPNTVSYDTLLKIGLEPKEAGRLISYRNKGGKFRKPSDINKVYGIDTVKSAMLIGHIVISREVTEKKYYPLPGQGKAKVDMNKCDSLSLIALPGIGPVLAVRIIKYRNLLGGFAFPEQLREVYGLPEETYKLIFDRIFADSLDVRKIKINSSDYKGLFRIPYIDKYEVSAILKYRELKGRMKAITDLTENNIIPPEKAKKMAPYLDFE